MTLRHPDRSKSPCLNSMQVQAQVKAQAWEGAGEMVLLLEGCGMEWEWVAHRGGTARVGWEAHP